MSVEGFTEDERPQRPSKDGLVLDLEGYEGPIDMLLQLAREQKVDITKISILALADQYLAFVREARRLRLELAADYLVMAAWLAYLKSRLLLPEPESDSEEPSGAEMAAALKFHLQRLQAMQEAGKQIMALPQLGRDRFARGAVEPLPRQTTVVYDVSLYELLKAYGEIRQRAEAGGLRILSLNLYSVEAALRRLETLIGDLPGWHTLASFLPADLRDDLSLRSALASTFAASLELCKSGKMEIRQDGTFGPIYVRSKTPKRDGDEDVETER